MTSRSLLLVQMGAAAFQMQETSKKTMYDGAGIEQKKDIQKCNNFDNKEREKIEDTSTQKNVVSNVAIQEQNYDYLQNWLNTNCFTNGDEGSSHAVSFSEVEDAKSKTTEKIKIIQNIVIRAPKSDIISNESIQALPNEAGASHCSSVLPESVDDSRDKDFDINNYDDGSSSSTDNSTDHDKKHSDGTLFFDISDKHISLPTDVNSGNQPISEQIKEKRSFKKKVVRCGLCNEDIISTNFLRHLERHHSTEREVQDILKFPKNSKDRRRALALFRNNTNFELFISGTATRPLRQLCVKESPQKVEFYPCAYCKGLFQKNYLKRHAKKCISRNAVQTAKKNNYVSNSQTLVACAIDTTDTIAKLNVKEKVFNLMKGDNIAYEAKKDILIAYFGECYLKKHRRENMVYPCSNRMRELSRLLIAYRNIVHETNVTFKELLHPKHFDNVVSAARNIAGFDPVKKTFKSPSLAMHLGTSLKLACNELIHLILKESRGFRCSSPAEETAWLKNVKNFKQLVEFRWNIELASLANKDMSEKRWNKPLLMPLVQDIKIFRDQCLKIASDCEKIFLDNKHDKKTYKLLVDCTLALLILFNRRRIGDVQYLKIADYNQDQRSDFVDFENVLTDTEKVLAKKYKRVLNSGKGSRAVVILVPEILQQYLTILLTNREQYISPDNEYVFASPGSTVKWGKGDVAIRTLTKKMKLANPQAITSNKLRKHIATVMQLLNLSSDEAKQFSNFMGHTQKTHEEFYELPVDVYQTAKVSKLLLMMEKGNLPLEHKGKSLAEINFDVNLEYAEENENDDDGNILNTVEELHTIENQTTDKDKPDAFNFADEDNDDAESDIISSKRKAIKRKGWSNQEISLLKKEFNSFLRKKTYPSGKEIKEFLKKTKMNRSVAIIKSKLQHLIRLAEK